MVGGYSDAWKERFRFHQWFRMFLVPFRVIFHRVILVSVWMAFAQVIRVEEPLPFV